ncbi:uncharacterized protein C16orf92 homolog [Camelus ferus]|uniref:Uncharacterized protein C16orf92 homolog n=2 Tax=Camelus TaxID=9836 RepID=A0A8B8REL1_CAMFR|nr:uncharacterized protein C16orf92 homolog [Camelus dromedarius]XP_032316403.1 uncharacterized protein C16orf92 homolog [Camelus ferus]XP_045364321.1 fertilization-influencing membrane protein [Camelus bactrianus]
MQGLVGKGPRPNTFLSPLTPECAIRMALGCDITEPLPHHKSGGVMRLWQWAWVWVWLVGLGTVESAPNPESAKALAPGAESPLFLDRPDFFDYPDSDQARLLALAQFIGERPVIFNSADSDSRLFHHILVGALVVAFFFLLFQFCTHM